MNDLLDQLLGGDLRSEGRAAEVAQQVADDPGLLPALSEGLGDESKLVRARTCMVLEILSRDHPEWMVQVMPQLIELALWDAVPQARWHIAEIWSRAPISEEDAERIVPILLGWLEGKSRIVVYCAVQALGVLGSQSASRKEIIDRIGALQGQGKSLDRAIAQALDALTG